MIYKIHLNEKFKKWIKNIKITLVLYFPQKSRYNSRGTEIFSNIAELFFLLCTSMVITAKNYKETYIKIFKSFRFYLISLAQSIYSWIVVYLYPRQ